MLMQPFNSSTSFEKLCELIQNFLGVTLHCHTEAAETFAEMLQNESLYKYY